jgi:hypothetical protein
MKFNSDYTSRTAPKLGFLSFQEVIFQEQDSLLKHKMD